jgi:hypothetical protein
LEPTPVTVPHTTKLVQLNFSNPQNKLDLSFAGPEKFHMNGESG